MTCFNQFCPTVAPAGCTSEALMLRFRLVTIGNSETALVYMELKRSTLLQAPTRWRLAGDHGMKPVLGAVSAHN